MKSPRPAIQFQNGFTAVEVLITLFVAAIFLIAGYQLFNVVIRDGGDARAESRAGNIAYTYMRKYSNAATNPCTPQTPVSNTAVTENTDGLTNAKVSIVITCPQSDAPTVSKVEAIITYNDPQKTTRFSTFVDKSKGATPNSDVTNGLVGWWKLNGNGNSEINPSANATATSVSAGTGQNGQANSAMNFTSLTSQLTGPTGNELASSSISFSFWVYPRSWSSTANANAFLAKRSTSAGTDGYIFGYLRSNAQLFADCSGVANRWTIAYAPPLNTWTHLVLVCNPTSIALYANGTSQSSRTSNDTSAITAATSAPFTIGNDNISTNNYGMDGLMDDMRVYNRALSGSEAAQLYAKGAQ